MQLAVASVVGAAGLVASVAVLGSPDAHPGVVAAAGTGVRGPAAVPGMASAAGLVGQPAAPAGPDCAPAELGADFLSVTGAVGAGALGAAGLGCHMDAVDALPRTGLEEDEIDLLYAMVTREQAIEPERYAPEDLVTVQGGPYQLRAEAAAAVEELLSAGEQEGHEWLVVTSGYRAYDVQAGTHQDWVGRVGEQRAAEVSAEPGHSEHQLGLAVDIGGACGLYDCLKDSEDGQWLADNAHRWGFIIRYPEGGEEVTGYAWEPWHLRYVGPRAAWSMHLDDEIYWEHAQPELLAGE